MSRLDVLSADRIEDGEEDVVTEAVARLARRLPQRTDARVVMDFLEDDLREGMGALSDVEAHFTDLLDTLRSSRLSPISLLEAADDQRVLGQLETLHNIVSRLRRRMSQAAVQLKRG